MLVTRQDGQGEARQDRTGRGKTIQDKIIQENIRQHRHTPQHKVMRLGLGYGLWVMDYGLRDICNGLWVIGYRFWVRAKSRQDKITKHKT